MPRPDRRQDLLLVTAVLLLALGILSALLLGGGDG